MKFLNSEEYKALLMKPMNRLKAGDRFGFELAKKEVQDYHDWLNGVAAISRDDLEKLKEQIAQMLREQGQRENTYEKQDCFERAAKMVEEML